MTNSKVVTWMAPGSDTTIDVTQAQEERLKASHRWPRDGRGVEYCQVSHGLHRGEPTYTDAEIEEMCR